MRAKKFIAAAAFAAVALFSGINAFNSSKEVQLSDLALANTEALASGEITVYPPCMWVEYEWCIYLHPDPNDDFELDGRLYI